MYMDSDYVDAVNFILNFPDKVLKIEYKESKDIYVVHLMDDGLYEIKLEGKLIRSALAWKGEREWVR